MSTAVCPRCGTENGSGRFLNCPTCLLDQDWLPDSLAGTYELYEKVGQGAMGTVYRARHKYLDRIVAIKFLIEPLGAGDDYHDGMDVEGHALGLLDHPNIVAVHDLRQESGHTYIVMEYVDGRRLADDLPLPLPRALKVADQMCDALSHGHRRGVVHGDIKPENILLDATGRVKISDFGVARLVGAETLAAAVAGSPVGGTRAYMAPEVVAGSAPDARTDVYAVGVVLHEMLTGHRPDSARGIEGPLAKMLQKALHPDPAARFTTIEDLRRELARTLDQPLAHAASGSDRRFIHLAAAGLAVASAVGLQSGSYVIRRAISGSNPEPFWELGEPTTMLLGALVAVLATLLAAATRWRQREVGAAPRGYETEGQEWMALSATGAILLAGLQAALGRYPAADPQWLHLPSSLAKLVALYWMWVGLLDAHRILQPTAGRLVLGLGLCAAPFFIGLL